VDFELSEELAELQATVRKLAQERVAPRAREIDETHEYPQDLFDLFVEAGLTGLCVPEEYGGSGAGILGLTIAIEEVAKYSNAAALMLLLTRLPTGPVMIAGSPEQNLRYVQPVATGEARAAFGLSEPQAGSDVMGMRTRAVQDGDDWRLTGTKCWMSGVRQADWYCVFAKTGPVDSRAHDSVSAFIVERSSPGVEVGRVDRKMGVKGVDTGELILDGARVPAANVIGEIGGFRLAMLGLNSMRPIVAARGIGLAEGALMYAVEYVKQRDAFGQTIADFQGIQWKIAELASEIEAARLLTYRAAWMADRSQFTKEYVPFLSMAKYYATELAVKVSGEALQMLGAAGYMEDHPTELGELGGEVLAPDEAPDHVGPEVWGLCGHELSGCGLNPTTDRGRGPHGR
jgi:alkylation response protein AidB-like acyl-CoA dehydrogenase